MAENVTQPASPPASPPASAVVQIPHYGHTDLDAAHWRARWVSLREVIEKTHLMIQDKAVAAQSAVVAWQQTQPTPMADWNHYEPTLAAIARQLADPALSALDFAQVQSLFDFVLEMTHSLIPKVSAYQGALACANVLDHLLAFAQVLFEFFDQGLYATLLTSNAATDADYTADFVFATLLEQISLDLNIIKQVFHQRYSEPQFQIEVGVDHPQRLTLIVADRLARLALQPALDHGFFGHEDKTVLTYLSRRLDVRMLPYHALALIGIPYAAQTTFEVNGRSLLPMANTYKLIVPTEYLAIPHEIGHHLYRYGQQDQTPVYQLLQDALRARLTERSTTLPRAGFPLRWLEEIFADVYGCLIAGPISVFGFQLMLATGQPRHDQEDAAKHPINLLRPLLQSQILRTIHQQKGVATYAAAADMLDTRWQQWVKTHWPRWVATQWPNGYDDQTDLLRGAIYTVDGEKLSGQAILETLQTVIDLGLHLLDKLLPENPTQSWTPDWHPYQGATPEQISTLYQNFVIFSFVETLRATFSGYADRFNLPEALQTPVDETQSELWLQARRAQWQQEQPGRSITDKVVDLILFQGWSTEGPTEAGHSGGG